MVTLSDQVVDEIVQNCLQLYQSLPKTGKPIENEWTVLSCILQHNNQTDKFHVVSLGTGSKCIGATQMSPLGEILNDSHSEVIARRGFLLYLYENIENYYSKNESIFVLESNKLKLKENISFIFYSSQLPCGDASIIPKTGINEDYGDILQSLKRSINDLNNEPKKQKLADIHRTGAKCLPESEQDRKEPGYKYHTVAQVRTKPGRGDHTLSVSCSDKIARWIHCGIQGSLIEMFLCEPIFIKHIIFGAGTPYSEETLKRAFFYRSSEEVFMIDNNPLPQLYHSTIVFPCIRSIERVKPAPGSIVWVKTKDPIFEVAVKGRKLGATKKNGTSLKALICISKYNIYQRLVHILSENDELRKSICGDESIYKVPYNMMKNKSGRYKTKWTKVKSEFFKIWTVKPDMWDFCINNS